MSGETGTADGPVTCHDDVGFIESLLDDLERSLCLDLDRVFATGISNGAMFVHRLGCDLPERFAAIAPVAGTLARGVGCAPSGSNRVSMMNIYGTTDTLVPADGSPGSDGFLYTPSTKVMDAWAGSQGCRPEESPYTTAFDGVRGLRCVERRGCLTGAEVVDCAWDGGHEWPGAGDDALSAGLIWDFFEKNGRPTPAQLSAAEIPKARPTQR